MTRARGVGLSLALLGVALPAVAEAQTVTLGAGAGLPSRPFRVFDQYRGSFAPDAVLDVQFARPVGGSFEVYMRLGFSAFGSVAVDDCLDACRQVEQYGGTVLTAGLGGGLRLTPRVTGKLGVGLAKFVGQLAGDDYALLLPSGEFHPRDLGGGPPTIGLEGAVRFGVTERWGVEMSDLLSLQAGPGSDGATQRFRLLLSWIASRKR